MGTSGTSIFSTIEAEDLAVCVWGGMEGEGVRVCVRVRREVGREERRVGGLESCAQFSKASLVVSLASCWTIFPTADSDQFSNLP